MKEDTQKELVKLDLDTLAANPIAYDSFEALYRSSFKCWGLICRIEGKMEESRKMFRILCNILFPRPSYSMNVDDYEITPGPFVTSIRGAQICAVLGEITSDMYFLLFRAIYYFFTDPHHPKVREFFECIAEKTRIPPGLTVEEIISYNERARLARMYVLHGYALTALGKFAEALPFLQEVIPLFIMANKQKENVRNWYSDELALPYALVPLCEYMVDPTEEKRIAAWNGRKKCQKKLESLDISYEGQLGGYLFYFHLQDMFPEVYIPPEKKKRSSKKKETKPVLEVMDEIPDYPESSRLEVTGEGGVVIQDIDETVWNFVLRVGPFYQFIDKIKSLEGYPVLSQADEHYTVGSGLDPGKVISECNLLLKEPSLTIEEREAVGEIGNMAMHARDHGAEIQFLYNDYW